MIDAVNSEISIKRQCELVGVNRSSYYYEPKKESEENLRIMEELDKQYLTTPFYGAIRMTEHLRGLEFLINIKRTRRLMRIMGLETVYCKPNLSKACPEHEIYPYLLRGVKIESVNQVWSTDITYIPMKHGFMYLSAVIDWHSRYIISWRLSNSLHVQNNIETLKEALEQGKPEIFNTDQGSQFTSPQFTEILKKSQIKISMDGRGRATDNACIERFWRSIKYENIYLHSYENVKELYQGVKEYIDFYNNRRLHQSLDYKTPSEIYNGYIKTKKCI
jgi:putative transposase